jgi:ABC-type transport system substrate-binding protein
LKVGWVDIGDEFFTFENFAFPDFAVEGTFGELLRCCLTRTLLTYPGKPTRDGGAELIPDLAIDLPDVAPDGRAWTFHLRHGIHYAPPHEQLEVTSSDLVRGLERIVRHTPFVAEPGGAFAAIAGAAEFGAGSAPAISGLETPDPYTLAIRLTEAYGGLNMAADLGWAPIPEAVASAHDEDMGAYWPSIGPYMYETYPASTTAAQSVLVRNPSWSRPTDTRRGAWPDRIEIAAVPVDVEPYAALDAGRYDLTTQFAPGEVADRYRADAQSAERLRSTDSETIFWIPMNVAVPPFDDLAVRRAVNFAINRAGTAELLIAARFGGKRPQNKPLLTTHVFPESLTEGLLIGYDPFPSRNQTGDLARARTEMSTSRYDSDRDGRCDAPVCSGIVMPSMDAALGEAVRVDLAQIGINVSAVEWTDDNRIDNVYHHTPIEVHIFGWAFALTGDDLAALLYGGQFDDLPEDGSTLNGSLVGASPQQLADWGYTVTEVPSVDDVIDRCEAETAHRRARCWSELDQLVSQSIAPWVPLFSFETAFVSSPAVADFAIDQGMGFPALENAVLAGQP